MRRHRLKMEAFVNPHTQFTDMKDVVVTPTHDIVLPYYREIVSKLPSPVPRGNYTPYHLFCLKKNIMPFIKSIDKNLSVDFSTVAQEDIMIVIMDIYKGGNTIVVKEDLHNIINRYLNKFIDLYPYCLLYNVKDSRYPREWLDMILPTLDMYEYRNNAIFVNLEDYRGFASEWDRMYFELIDKLKDLYHRGVVQISDEKLIQKWNLINLRQNLYFPNWKYCFTTDKTRFLLDLLSSKGRNKIILYTGSKYQEKTEGWLVADVSSYQEVVNLLEF